MDDNTASVPSRSFEENAVELPLGFRFAGVACGIKRAADRLDLSLVVADGPVTAAGVYTQNQVFAAPVGWCRGVTPTADVRAVVTNSGNANACTGARGDADAAEMAAVTARLVQADNPQQVLVLSTGVIGHFLPMDRVRRGIESAVPTLAADSDAFLRASDAILTTDQSRKIATRQLSLGTATIRIAGMAKGAGMIGPNMATMLAIVLTDAPLEPAQAQAMLQRAADTSFNCISVEGHTSTNDTLLLLASGAAPGLPLDVPLPRDQQAMIEHAITELCIELAKQIPTDGEGASHLIEIRVSGAADDPSARTIASAVAASALVKTAIAGNDPNWGRIVSAAGYAGPAIDVARTKLAINEHVVFEDGRPTEFDRMQVHQSMRDAKTVVLDLIVGSGAGRCTHWTSDLNEAYVKFNAEYTT
jgi:glutamate N-acetyltransferase/amino-acid N-acetyltransferase